MPAILVLTGASGSGKTTLLQALEQMALPGVVCLQCDTIYDDLPEDIRADGEVAQDAILEHWLMHVLASPGIELGVLDTQIRPHKAQAMLRRLGVAMHQVVVVECEQAEREARLHGPRAQPELANPKMECWAAYMRGQADALGLERIDTSGVPIADSAARLRSIAELLLRRLRAAAGGRLIVICGLPGSGKTTHARALAAKEPRSVRLCPDEWMDASAINLWETGPRAQIEAFQWQLAKELLAQGRIVIIEWGTWGRSERDTLRLGARALGAKVELHYLDAPIDVLIERVRHRRRESPAVTREDLQQWSEAFERPDRDEMALFDGFITSPS